MEGEYGRRRYFAGNVPGLVSAACINGTRAAEAANRQRNMTAEKRRLFVAGKAVTEGRSISRAISNRSLTWVTIYLNKNNTDSYGLGWTTSQAAFRWATPGAATHGAQLFWPGSSLWIFLARFVPPGSPEGIFGQNGACWMTAKRCCGSPQVRSTSRWFSTNAPGPVTSKTGTEEPPPAQVNAFGENNAFVVTCKRGFPSSTADFHA